MRLKKIKATLLVIALWQDWNRLDVWSRSLMQKWHWVISPKHTITPRLHGWRCMVGYARVHKWRLSHGLAGHNSRSGFQFSKLDVSSAMASRRRKWPIVFNIYGHRVSFSAVLYNWNEWNAEISLPRRKNLPRFCVLDSSCLNGGSMTTLNQLNAATNWIGIWSRQSEYKLKHALLEASRYLVRKILNIE